LIIARARTICIGGAADCVWTIGDLIDAALATQPITPVPIAPDRRKLFKIVQGGKA
jgi:hypothetical protein